MNKISLEKYNQDQCPVCKATKDKEGYEAVIVGKCGDTWQLLSCAVCDASWCEQYELTGVLIDE